MKKSFQMIALLAVALLDCWALAAAGRTRLSLNMWMKSRE